MQSPNLPKLIAQINASPSFYMRTFPHFFRLLSHACLGHNTT
jgi:hypothetical protein